MGELSKTADAARKAVERSHKKEAKELTVEERIANIRKNLDAGLYVPATEVSILLAEYDRVLVATAGIAVDSSAHKAVEELETIPR